MRLEQLSDRQEPILARTRQPTHIPTLRIAYNYAIHTQRVAEYYKLKR
jgi:hypothetical protein